MRGGLLGTGHSWVAMPSSRPDNGDAIAKSNTHLHDKPEETPLSLLDRTCARFYNACEDVCDSLVDPPIMPRSALASGTAAAVAAGLAWMFLRSDKT